MCTPDEIKIIDEWYAAIEGGENAFVDPAEERMSKEKAWAAVDEHIRRKSHSGGNDRGHRALSGWGYIGIAATLIFAVAFLVYNKLGVTARAVIADASREEYSDMRSVSNDNTKPLKFSLPDGSKITLSPESSLRYSASFTAAKREVFLEGEAFFEVERDIRRPFLVYTSDLTTKVLGTCFRVKAYEGEKETTVTVKTGKVSVQANVSGGKQSKQHRAVILTPNEQAVYHPGEIVPQKKIVQKPEVILPEPTLETHFTNTPVVTILKSLMENYGIEIKYDSVALAKCTLTSDMSEEGFYEQISILCNALGAEYHVAENAVIINATGCNDF